MKYAEIDTFPHVRTQGIFALDDCSINDGGFQCIPGFHTVMKDVWIDGMGEERIKSRVMGHRYQFATDDPLIECITKCPIRKGSFLAWNSKVRVYSNYLFLSELRRNPEF